LLVRCFFCLLFHFVFLHQHKVNSEMKKWPHKRGDPSWGRQVSDILLS
jgi:hypothetical protein